MRGASQHSVCRNPSPRSRATSPYFLLVQSDLLAETERVVVVPLVTPKSFGTPIRRLNPVFEVEGRPVVMATLEIHSMRRNALGERVASLAHSHDAIVAAVDFLLQGV